MSADRGWRRKVTKSALRGSYSLLAATILVCTIAKSDNVRERNQKALFRVSVNTVFLRVSVTDRFNRCFTGLGKENFKIYEDKVQQEISIFTQEPSPVSIGIVLDTSGSMKARNNMHEARMALKRFLANVNPGDEFLLITFNGEVSLQSNFTHDTASILGQSALAMPSGSTAIKDAVYLALGKMKWAKNEKRGIVLITDGEDNSSRYSLGEVRDFARESDTRIYAIGRLGELGYGSLEINNIVEMTGGRAFFPNNLSTLDSFIGLIQSELRNEYIIGYVPVHLEHNGKWRKVDVKLDVPEQFPKLTVRTKEGYYALKN
jgi:Ca-activated chloride channel family protein